jgi:D-3-phosphoglycerate dehydrogenase
MQIDEKAAMDRPNVIGQGHVPEAVSGNAIVEALVLDLLEWVAGGERSYAEVMEAWRTSCPRLPVWEDANDRGLVARVLADGRAVVRITPAGRALLARQGR